MLSKSKIFVTCQFRWCSTVPHPLLLETVNNLLNNKEIKHRQHPGIIKKNVITLPKPIFTAIDTILEDSPNRKKLYAESIQFRNHLHHRHTPVEEKDRKALYEHTHERYLKQKNFQELTTEKLDLIKRKNEPKVQRFIKQWANQWQETVYNNHKSLLYLIVRSVPNYAVLYAIFNEIRNRDKEFKPKTVLDFGSGIGSTLWTINDLWPNEVKEFVNVDISNEINDISEKIAKILYPRFTGILYRQFMPMSMTANYDITVSAHSLIELPNANSRLDAIMKLWRKTKNYLVIVEEGTIAGFQIITEARDFILHLSNLNENHTSSAETHVFAPCPHDFDCPKPKYCYFEAGFNSIPFLGTKIRYERYSYVVFKKGPKLGNDSDWPRLISSPIKRARNVLCHLCHSSGELKDVIFTPGKHGKNLYRCAKSCKWGDRIPLNVNIKSDENVYIDSESVKTMENTNVETIENDDDDNNSGQSKI